MLDKKTRKNKTSRTGCTVKFYFLEVDEVWRQFWEF